MIDVFDNVKAKVGADILPLCDNIIDEVNIKVRKFPTVALIEINNPDVGIDMEQSEVATDSQIEVQAFSNKSKVEALAILTACDRSFKSMGYRRIMGFTMIPNIDISIKRMMARYERIIGNGETLTL